MVLGVGVPCGCLDGVRMADLEVRDLFVGLCFEIVVIERLVCLRESK